MVGPIILTKFSGYIDFQGSPDSILYGSIIFLIKNPDSNKALEISLTFLL